MSGRNLTTRSGAVGFTGLVVDDGCWLQHQLGLLTRAPGGGPGGGRSRGLVFNKEEWPLVRKTSYADVLGSAGKCSNLQGKKEFMVFMT